VFVAPAGDDAAAGTKLAPVRTLARAIELAADKGRVFACVGSYPESELSVPAGISIFGGLDCANEWGWTAVPSLIVAEGRGVIFRGEGTSVAEDLEIDVAAVELAGASAIGVWIDTAVVVLRRVRIDAGPGRPGLSPMPFAAPAAAGVVGDAGFDAYCWEDPAPGTSLSTTNPSCIATVGGAGGVSSGPDAASKGTGGLPFSLGGEGGRGCSTNYSWGCQDGVAGLVGSRGGDGVGGAGIGTFDLDEGWRGPHGTHGDPGGVGGGGGGGGGDCGDYGGLGCESVTYGGAGGGGGAGGCGGSGGLAGGSGGSSFGIIVQGGSVQTIDVDVNTGDAGDGGDGIAGQLGGQGLGGGSGGSGACHGGSGGDGGAGGAGGGGGGGSSIGVMVLSAEWIDGPGTSIEFGAAGAGGDGGTEDVDIDGEPGLSAATHDAS
jgi:hypothetical protein